MKSLICAILFYSSLAFGVALDFDFTPVNNLSFEQKQEDLSVLTRAIAEAYAGPRADALAGLRAMNLMLTGTSSADFCKALTSALAGVKDRHLRLFLNFQVCSAHMPVGNVGANLAGTSTWKVTQVSSADILAIASFPDEEDSRWNGFLDAVANLKSSGRDFILDLRGNTGGDDSFGIEMARVLFGLGVHEALPTPLKTMRYVQSASAFARQVEDWTYQIARLQSRNLPVPNYFSEMQNKNLGFYRDVLSSSPPAEHNYSLPVGKVNPATVFSGKVFVLIDHSCASACETTLQALEALPGRVLVGESTVGAVEYGDVGMLLLPNSHLAVQLARLQNIFQDGRHPEVSGYAPQIAVPAGSDALKAALAAF